MEDQLTTGELKALADEFWQGFKRPHELRKAVRKCRLNVVELAGLSYSRLKEWYAVNCPGKRDEFPVEDRELHGFYTQSREDGIIFLNKDDDPPEKRFSLAHELAHFLVEYDRHRKWAEEAMDAETARHFLKNRTTTNERTKGLLYGVSFGPFQHFLEKEQQTGFHRYGIAVAEGNADLLALELLAPRLEVQAQLTERSFPKAIQQLKSLLMDRYQLPEIPALSYAESLAEEVTGGPSFEDWLEMGE